MHGCMLLNNYMVKWVITCGGLRFRQRWSEGVGEEGEEEEGGRAGRKLD